MSTIVTVLGASGFIGSAVTAALAECGYLVRAVSRGHRGRLSPHHDLVEPVVADVTDRGRMAEILDGTDAVINLVLQDGGWRTSDTDPDASEALNVTAVRHLVSILSAGTGRSAVDRLPVVVHAGAVSQVGLPSATPIDGSEPDRPVTAYDRHKLAAEQVLLDAAAAGRIRATVLRLPTVYGTGRGADATDNGVITAMIRRALNGQPLTMWNDGSVRRDAIHVDDVAAAFVTALAQIDRLSGRHWLIGSGRTRTLGEIFALIADTVGAVTDSPAVPVRAVDAPSTALVTDFHSLDIDIRPFAARTGWAPGVRLQNGITRIVDQLWPLHPPGQQHTPAGH
ncbi:NAD-dependent epimerase/dehydratase family protein [Salinifilum ghardaiensis]